MPLQGGQGQQPFQQRNIMGGFRQQQQPQQPQQPGHDQQQQMQNELKQRNVRLYNDIPAAVLQSLVRTPVAAFWLDVKHVKAAALVRLAQQKRQAAARATGSSPLILACTVFGRVEGKGRLHRSR